MLANAGAALRRIGMGLGKEGGGRLPGTMSAALRPGAGQKNLIGLGLEGSAGLRAVSTRAKGLRDLSCLALGPLESASALTSLRAVGGAGSGVVTAMSGSSPSLRLLRHPLGAQSAAFSSSALGSFESRGNSAQSSVAAEDKSIQARLDKAWEEFPFFLQSDSYAVKGDVRNYFIDRSQEELKSIAVFVSRNLNVLVDAIDSGHDCFEQAAAVASMAYSSFHALDPETGVFASLRFSAYVKVLRYVVDTAMLKGVDHPNVSAQNGIGYIPSPLMHMLSPLLNCEANTVPLDDQLRLISDLTPLLSRTFNDSAVICPDGVKSETMLPLVARSAAFLLWTMQQPDFSSRPAVAELAEICLRELDGMFLGSDGAVTAAGQTEFTLLRKIFSTVMDLLIPDPEHLDSAVLSDSFQRLVAQLQEFEEDEANKGTVLSDAGLFSWRLNRAIPGLLLGISSEIQKTRQVFTETHGLFVQDKSAVQQVYSLSEGSFSPSSLQERLVYCYSSTALLLRLVNEGRDFESMPFLNKVLDTLRMENEKLVPFLPQVESELLKSLSDLFTDHLRGVASCRYLDLEAGELKELVHSEPVEECLERVLESAYSASKGRASLFLSSLIQHKYDLRHMVLMGHE